MMSSIRLQHYYVTSCKQGHLIVKHLCCKGVSIFYKHRKFRKVSSINEGDIAFSKKVHVFLRHPVNTLIFLLKKKFVKAHIFSTKILMCFRYKRLKFYRNVN